MAEGNNASGESWESWFGGWVQTAKEKSSTALEMVKKDLAEFTCTMHKDTEDVVEKTRESLKKENTVHATDKVKAGLSSLLGNISKALVIPPDDDYVPMKVAADGSGLYDRGKARLHAIQLDASTYVDPPRGPSEQFNMWLESFNMEEHKGEISELLVSKVEVRALYTKLVPSEVSHAEFWQRYFYRVHQLQCDEARKKALMQRADETKKDSFTWDDDEDWSGAEDDDGNHSDWEKMPRPPQSYAAKLPTQASQKQTSSSLASKMASEKGQINVQNSNFTPIQDNATDIVVQPMKIVPGEEVTGQGAGSKLVAVLETSMSAFAAGTSDPQSFPEKPDLGIEKPKDMFVESSEDMQNASGQSSGFLAQKPSSDLWSLHIPTDTASASHPGENEYQSVETANLEPGSPSDVYRQGEEANKTQRSLHSCAASGGDVSPSLSTKPEVTSADGACGASDLGPAPVNPQPLQPIAEPSPDISAACIEVANELTNAPLSGQDASLQGFSSSSGSPQTPANQVPVASTVSASIISPSVQNADNVTLPQEKVEKVSEISANENDLGTVAKEKASEIMPAPQQTASQASEIPGLGDAELSSTEVVQTPEISVPSAKSAEEGEGKEIGMRVKGDMVVVGDRDSPASSDSSDHKEIDDDWEQDFDIEVTEEDLKAAEDIAKRLGENLDADDDDWENWE